MRPTYLTPGPSQLYPTVERHLASALAENILSISHRSQVFMDFYAGAVQGLKQLLHAPAEYEVFFFSSATEIWERLTQNCISAASFHLVNGDFSGRFRDTVRAYGKQAHAHEVPDGEGFHLDNFQVPQDAELIAAIGNETSTGVWTPPDLIHDLAARHPEKLVVVDAVSCAPLYPLDLSKVDGYYFSVQKCFGLPAGLGVLLCSPRLIVRAEALAQEGHFVGSYHRFASLLQYARKNQTPETPNVLGICLLSRVVQDMLGEEARIREESRHKAAQLYAWLDAHPRFKPFVEHKPFRSETVVVVTTRDGAESDLMLKAQKALSAAGLHVGEGYGKHKLTQFRIANFPAIPTEAIDKVLEVMHAL